MGTMLLVKRRERGCDGRQALGMESCCYGAQGEAYATGGVALCFSRLAGMFWL
jgi:hypothetical protein